MIAQQTSYPHPLGAGSARPNPKMGAPDPENPLFQRFSVLKRGLRPWSQARPWGRGRSGDWGVGGPEGYFSLAIIAFGASGFVVPKYYYRLGKMEKRGPDSLI